MRLEPALAWLKGCVVQGLQGLQEKGLQLRSATASLLQVTSGVPSLKLTFSQVV